MAVHILVAVPAALTVGSLGAHVEVSLLTTVASAAVAQEPEPDVAEPVLPVVHWQVERSPSADGAVAKRHPHGVGWVDDEAVMASRKARVIEVSSSPPPVPACHTMVSVASAAGGVGSDCHARNPGVITVGRGRRRKGRGGRH